MLPDGPVLVEKDSGRDSPRMEPSADCTLLAAESARAVKAPWRIVL